MDEKFDKDLDDIEVQNDNVNEENNVVDNADEFITPDRDVFSQAVNGNVSKKQKRKKGFAATWHGTEDNKDNFDVDESFTSSATADKSFMKAFGISETGNHRTISDIDKSQKTQEFISNDEYTDVSERQQIRENYKSVKRSNIRKIIASVIFAIFLFVQENVFGFIHIDGFDYFDIEAHPYIHIIASLVALFACAICAKDQIIQGTRSIFKKDYTPDSVAPIALVGGIIYTVTTLIFVAVGYNTNIMLLNFPVAAILVGSIIYFHLNIKRERYGFAVVSFDHPKFVLEKVQESNAESEFDTFTTTTTNGGDYMGQIARTAKTPFVKNFFYNTNTTVDIRKYLKFYYIFATAIPLVMAIVSMFLDKTELNPYMAITYFFVGVFCVLPVGILFSYSVPFLIANTRLFANDKVSIIGEEAIVNFANVDAAVVNDTAAFPYKNVKVSPINLYNSFTFEQVAYYAASGFSIVGGPLAQVFNNMLDGSMSKSSKVKFVCAGRNYLRVTVDGHAIIFADKNGMTIQNIEVGGEHEDNKGLSIMYMACDGELCSKMYIDYKINKEFLQTTKYVNSKNMIVGIRTFDPNISNDLINRVTGFTKKQVKVIKLTSISDVPSVTQRRDGQIVSKGSSCALLRAVPMCRRILKTRKVIKAIKIISSVLGLAYLGVCIFSPISFGPLNVLPSGVIVLLHMVFALIMYIATCMLLPKNKKK